MDAPLSYGAIPKTSEQPLAGFDRPAEDAAVRTKRVQRACKACNEAPRYPRRSRCHADDGRIILKGAKHDRCASCVVDCKDDGVGNDVVEVNIRREDKLIGVEGHENRLLELDQVEIAAALNTRERG